MNRLKTAWLLILLLALLRGGYAMPNEPMPKRPSYSPARGKGYHRAYRRLRYKMVTVNVYKYNRKVRLDDDRELRTIRRQNKHPERAHSKQKAKHILLRNSTE